jgi:hypothetical protein
MNKVHGKTIFYPKWTFHSKVMTRNLFFAKNGQLLSLLGTREKTFLFQSVQSTFEKHFTHVPQVV